MTEKNNKTVTIILISIFVLLAVFSFVAIKIFQKKQNIVLKNHFINVRLITSVHPSLPWKFSTSSPSKRRTCCPTCPTATSASACMAIPSASPSPWPGRSTPTPAGLWTSPTSGRLANRSMPSSTTATLTTSRAWKTRPARLSRAGSGRA